METELFLWTIIVVQKFSQCLALNFPSWYFSVQLLTLSLVAMKNCLVSSLLLPFVHLKTLKSPFRFLCFRLNGPFNFSWTMFSWILSFLLLSWLLPDGLDYSWGAVLVTENVLQWMLHLLLQTALRLGSTFAFGNVNGTCSDLLRFNPQTFYSSADLSFTILYLCSVIYVYNFTFFFPQYELYCRRVL